jgi:hypothetical protein
LTFADVPALRRLLATAQRIASHLAATATAHPAPIQLGFHAVPSLEPLHLHLVSQVEPYRRDNFVHHVASSFEK